MRISDWSSDVCSSDLKAQIAIDRVEQRAKRLRLIDHLGVRAEDMRVVLRELADTHDAVQRAVRLDPGAAAELGQPQRQVAIAGEALTRTSVVVGKRV